MNGYRPDWAEREMLLMNDAPYARHLGIRITDVAEGYAKVIMSTIAPYFGNRFGIIHGGGICSLIDVAASMAVRSTVLPGQRTATIGLSVDFMAGAKGKQVVAEGHVTRRGATLGFVDVMVRDEDGTPVAKGGGTFMIFRMDEGTRTD
ncbi:MAG: PaaI family thioesterase [Dehalococcoidia bacterium]|nr:PaaI family thioesterase [Dehalococcoidia bacterium]